MEIKIKDLIEYLKKEDFINDTDYENMIEDIYTEGTFVNITEKNIIIRSWLSKNVYYLKYNLLELITERKLLDNE